MFYRKKSTNDKRLDNIGIDVMQLKRKLASIGENAGLDSSHNLCPAWWGWTAMTENALDVLAPAPVKAR